MVFLSRSRSVSVLVFLLLSVFSFWSSNAIAQVSVSPRAYESTIARFISVAPEPTSELTHFLAEITVADLQDLLNNQSEVDRVSNQLFYELRDAQLQRGPGYLAKVLRNYADKGVSLTALRELVFKKTGGVAMTLEIPTHPVVMKGETSTPTDEANKRLRRVGIDFIQFKAVRAEDAQRSDEAYPAHEPGRLRMEKIRNRLVPTLAFLSAASAGYLASRGFEGLNFWLHMAPSLALGGIYAFTEWQFSKFSHWWNKNVWEPLDAAGPATANATIPFLFFLAGWGMQSLTTYVGLKLGIEIQFEAKTARDIAREVGLNFAFFMASFGLSQTALARFTKRGEMSEGPRYCIESPLCIVANSGRSFGIASPFLGNAQADLYAKIFAYVVQGGVALVVTIPAWSKILFGDARYDKVTADRLKTGVAQPGDCTEKLGLLGRFWNRVKKVGTLQFSKQ